MSSNDVAILMASYNGAKYISNQIESIISQSYKNWDLYIRDDGARKYFSITPEPVRDEDEYDIEHGFGYSIFKHTANNITGQLTMFCPKNKKLKLCKVLLENKSSEGKGLTLFYYSSMVLGVYSYKSTKYISTDIEENFIYAQNPFNKYFYKNKIYLTILGG